MNEPHLWCLFRDADLVRLMMSWRGTYVTGGSWRINSGIDYVDETESHYIVHGISGSEYHVPKCRYGSSPYSSAVMDEMEVDPMSEIEAFKYLKAMLSD